MSGDDILGGDKPDFDKEPTSEQKTAAREAADAAAADTPLPEVTFATFIMSLASSALVQLGEVPEPESGRVMENLPVAKHTIDILTMLHDKTGNCLTPDEKRLMEGLLYELRMKYVMKKN